MSEIDPLLGTTPMDMPKHIPNAQLGEERSALRQAQERVDFAKSPLSGILDHIIGLRGPPIEVAGA